MDLNRAEDLMRSLHVMSIPFYLASGGRVRDLLRSQAQTRHIRSPLLLASSCMTYAFPHAVAHFLDQNVKLEPQVNDP